MNQVVRQHGFETGQSLQIVEGDLTQEEVGAIVNAANAYLKHGAGVAGAIISRGGGQIQLESDAWVQENGPVSHERPAYTGAGRLPCRYVIHAVGPVWGSGDEQRKLAAAIGGSLEVAESLGVNSLAFPAISTGIFGFPKDLAASIFYRVIESYFREHPNSGLRQVRLTLFDRSTLDAFISVWQSQGFDQALPLDP
jgi:O-acetyl-ADP-ribose deacetylase (regulator of RNase III)